jgi:hypothetical protein
VRNLIYSLIFFLFSEISNSPDYKMQSVRFRKAAKVLQLRVSKF